VPLIEVQLSVVDGYLLLIPKLALHLLLGSLDHFLLLFIYLSKQQDGFWLYPPILLLHSRKVVLALILGQIGKIFI
jgi:hypothetical protein